MVLEIVDSLIGFATVILLLSVLVTALAQATQSALRLRGRNLQRGLERLFHQAMIATQNAGSGKPVGLLVVHGMGRQKAGATRESVVRGLRKAYPEARFEICGTRTDMICAGRRIRIYEVHWAPVLMGKRIHGSFSLDLLYQFVWFPLLNGETGSFREADYGEGLVSGWHKKLLRLAVLVGSVYKAIKVPLGLVDRYLDPWLKKNWGREIAPAAAFDNLLADSIGDVFNYVKACVGVPAPVPRAPVKIYQIFRKELTAAARECSEVQILAHSMGTLVVHHALTCFSSRTRQLVALTAAEAGPGRPHLNRLYTIGTPLEKIRFFWPKVIDLDKMDEGDFRWDNFRSPLDVVAGEMRLLGKKRVKRINNEEVRGAGGLITAHNGYRTHPTFLRVFGPGLTNCPTDIRPMVTWTWLLRARDRLESIVASLAFLLLVAVGAAGIFLLGYYFVLAVLHVSEAGQDWPEIYARVIAATVGFVMTSVSLFSTPHVAETEARKIHEAYGRNLPDRAGAAGRDDS